MWLSKLSEFFSKSKKPKWSELDNSNLIETLEEAQKLLSQYSGGYSGKFFSVEEFYEIYSQELIIIRNSNNPNFEKFYYWFLPTCTFDDFTGMDGIKVANKASIQLDKWHSTQEESH